MTESTRKARRLLRISDAPLHRYPRWAPRFWHGMDFFTWITLLVRNRFSVAPIRLSMVDDGDDRQLAQQFFERVRDGYCSAHRIRSAKLKEPPLFVLGHWRSGTTLLHELLMLDPRHTCPTRTNASRRTTSCGPSGFCRR